MHNIVSNPSADREEKIEHAAKILRASKNAKAVFELVYKGQKQFKTIDDMRSMIRGFNTNTYQAANRLAAEDILEKRIASGRHSYYKVKFYTHNRNHILRLCKNKQRLKDYPTKMKVKASGGKTIFAFASKPQVKQISLEEVGSFRKARKAAPNVSLVRGMYERTINRAICRILNEKEKKDWGGERNDIFSTRLVLGAQRIGAAFALKGKGTRGKLTPAKMGTNGDQIARLFGGTASIHFVIHNDDIDESIHDLMQVHAIEKSVRTGKRIYWSVADGRDLSQLVQAYPTEFGR